MNPLLTTILTNKLQEGSDKIICVRCNNSDFAHVKSNGYTRDNINYAFISRQCKSCGIFCEYTVSKSNSNVKRHITNWYLIINNSLKISWTMSVSQDADPVCTISKVEYHKLTKSYSQNGKEIVLDRVIAFNIDNKDLQKYLILL